ncbi:GGDEF domain-containing protein [Methylobrevis pamukkalensis]|uniref:diguanylate cyclase n=1 Tax=Methylobrevis pamukkalensis TaxID=1439726 RepID=A0A1E3H0W0_9HYPH|nr:GGDEF domain-containing protein [Methylobrevis pamukkalensis]ODN69940.1 putative diguanylate cyclase YdaM [Methylobrevis pamukkalensis]
MAFSPSATNLPILTTIMVLLGCFFALAWLRDRRQLYNFSWTIAYLLGAAAGVLLAMRGTVPDLLSIGAANTVALLANGVFWCGIREFEGRPVRPFLAALPAGGWMALCFVPAFYETYPLRVAYVALAVAVFGIVCGREIWRNRRRDPLPSRVLALVVFSTHGAFHLVIVALAVAQPHRFGASLQDSPWFGLMVFERVIQIVALGVILIGLGKERAERDMHRLAMTDMLTGLANRRAFFSRAEAALAQTRHGAFILFDLDFFKAINDSHGHIAGDRALAAFARALEIHAGEGAVLGRLGGEEFGCLLPAGDIGAAADLADRVRDYIAAMRMESNGRVFRMTVSAGVAEIGEGGLDGVYARADAALYLAKSRGRNRVELDDAPVDLAAAASDRVRLLGA